MVKSKILSLTNSKGKGIQSCAVTCKSGDRCISWDSLEKRTPGKTSLMKLLFVGWGGESDLKARRVRRSKWGREGTESKYTVAFYWIGQHFTRRYSQFLSYLNFLSLWWGWIISSLCILFVYLWLQMRWSIFPFHWLFRVYWSVQCFFPIFLLGH